MKTTDSFEFSAALARALGVDVSPGQLVTKIVLTIEPGKTPRLDVTRLVAEEGAIGAVEKVMTTRLEQSK